MVHRRQFCQTLHIPHSHLRSDKHPAVIAKRRMESHKKMSNILMSMKRRSKRPMVQSQVVHFISYDLESANPYAIQTPCDSFGRREGVSLVNSSPVRSLRSLARANRHNVHLPPHLVRILWKVSMKSSASYSQ